MWGASDLEFGGVQFFDKNGKKILQAGYTAGTNRKEFLLADGERLVGIKSKLRVEKEKPRQDDLQFVIGFME